MIDILVLFACGLAGGFLAGLLGVGGGIIYVFVLGIYLERFSPGMYELPRLVIANSIFATFFAGLSASFRNIRIKNFFWNDVLLVGISGALSTLFVSWTLLNFEWYNRERFSVFFLVLLLVFFWQMVRKKKNPNREEESGSTWGLIATGVSAGLISALSGLGGGVIMIPVLSLIFHYRMERAASISLGVIPFFALAMSLFYGFQSQELSFEVDGSFGYILPHAVLPMVAGVFIAAPIGVNTARKLPSRVIKIMFASVLLIVALKFVFNLLNTYDIS